ncbi:restriction endonuclease subunit S [Coprobacter secundus]|uniref:restriction endonuclease subunit S n=1 Tax=Coprobacter secundus TaxID=1501392 RepID=UPI0023F6B2E3|nr:restriction endonuclease subunit S [Coprobacter secundus]
MERYREYKDSGAQWLGKIPKHWDVIKAKYLWNEVFSFSENGSENLLSVSQYEGVTQAKNESRSESLKGYKKVAKDNLVINIMLAWMGGLGVSEYNGIVSPAYCVYRLKKAANPKFMHYLYKTPMYLAEFARHSTGVIPSRWRMYTDDFGQVLTLIPPIDEQDKIVSYLDKVTSKIDEAIVQQQKMIDLLNERKQIIINNAVTKGLNPDAPMKDSGVDWIGEIPEHWELKQYRHLFHNLDYLRKPITADLRSRNNPLYDYYGATGIIDKIDHFNIEDKVLLIAEDGANLLLRNLPLIYKAEGRFWVNNHAHILKPIKDDYDFLAYVMESTDYTLYITGSAQPKLSQANLNAVKLPIPPLYEQLKIVEHIKAKTEGIDFSIYNAKRMLTLLQERKQIIINDVVTGKVKVS